MDLATARQFAELSRAPALPETIADAIQARIRSGDLPAGSRLPAESSLAADFGVSRPMVREAIARLRRDGLVVTRKGSGAWVEGAGQQTVFRISSDCFEKRRELQQILQLRTSVESDAAALAARHRSAAALASMDEAVRQMVGAAGAPRSAESVGRWFDAEGDLYQAIARASGNSFFVDFLQLVDARVRMKLRIAALNNVRVAEMRADVLAEHRAIVEAIRAREADVARDAARLHFEKAAVRIARRKDLRD